MCDEERYLFLNYDNTTGIDEDNVDEESKKGQTNAIGYDYSRFIIYLLLIINKVLKIA